MKPINDSDYINSPNTCPFCESEDLDADILEQDNDTEVIRLVDCHSCGKTWREVYKLDGYEVVDDNANEPDLSKPAFEHMDLE